MSAAKDVPAHSSPQTHRYTVHFPEHPARITDPHYVDFNHYHKLHRPTARCYVGERIGFDECLDAQGNLCVIDANGEMSGLELHHAYVEFSLQNGISLSALEKDFPGISDATDVGAWVESDTNFRWLCVLPGSPVLMADRSWRAIEDVLPGEWVIGGHGRADQVVATSRKRYSGEAVKVGPASLTASHRVATDRGWVPIGQVAEEIAMFGSQMVRLRCVEDEVGWSVVRPISVDMVNSFAGQHRPTNHPLHDKAMLHDKARSVPNAHIPLRGELRSLMSDVPLRESVESCQSTGIGAIATRTRLPTRTSLERSAANLAGKSRALGWLTVDHPVRTLYSGWVHDLSIAHSNSFIVGGLVVHNCVFHHRAAGGAHTASHSDWTASQYVRGLISKS